MFDPQTKLVEQRTIFVSGPLDDAAVAELTATLMLLDGVSPEPIELVVNSTGGSISTIGPLLDVISVLAAPVETTCLGAASGTAAVLVATATGERRATPRASFSLRCEGIERHDGTAAELAAVSDQLTSLTTRIVELLTEATGRPEAVIVEWLERGSTMTAHEAVEAGLIDRLAPGRSGPRPA